MGDNRVMNSGAPVNHVGSQSSGAAAGAVSGSWDGAAETDLKLEASPVREDPSAASSGSPAQLGFKINNLNQVAPNISVYNEVRAEGLTQETVQKAIHERLLLSDKSSKDSDGASGGCHIPPEEYPDWYKEGQYDVALVFHEDDKDAADAFRRMLLRVIPGDCKWQPKICMINSMKWTNSFLDELHQQFEKATFIFLFVTDKFIGDAYCQLQKDELIMATIQDCDKRWKVVPVLPRKPKKRLPMGIKSLHAETLYRLCPPGCDIAFSLNNINTGNIQNYDRYFVPGLEQLLRDKVYMRRQREERDKRELIFWKENELCRRRKALMDESEEFKEREAMRKSTAVITKRQGTTIINITANAAQVGEGNHMTYCHQATGDEESEGDVVLLEEEEDHGEGQLMEKLSDPSCQKPVSHENQDSALKLTNDGKRYVDQAKDLSDMIDDKMTPKEVALVDETFQPGSSQLAHLQSVPSAIPPLTAVAGQPVAGSAACEVPDDVADVSEGAIAARVLAGPFVTPEEEFPRGPDVPPRMDSLAKLDMPITTHDLLPGESHDQAQDVPLAAPGLPHHIPYIPPAAQNVQPPTPDMRPAVPDLPRGDIDVAPVAPTVASAGERPHHMPARMPYWGRESLRRVGGSLHSTPLLSQMQDNPLQVLMRSLQTYKEVCKEAENI